MSEDQLLDSTILFTHKKGIHGGNGPMTEPISPKLKLIWNIFTMNDFRQYSDFALLIFSIMNSYIYIKD